MANFLKQRVYCINEFFIRHGYWHKTTVVWGLLSSQIHCWFFMGSTSRAKALGVNHHPRLSLGGGQGGLQSDHCRGLHVQWGKTMGSEPPASLLLCSLLQHSWTELECNGDWGSRWGGRGHFAYLSHLKGVIWLLYILPSFEFKLPFLCLGKLKYLCTTVLGKTAYFTIPLTILTEHKINGEYSKKQKLKPRYPIYFIYLENMKVFEIGSVYKTYHKPWYRHLLDRLWSTEQGKRRSHNLFQAALRQHKYGSEMAATPLDAGHSSSPRWTELPSSAARIMKTLHDL